MRGTHPLATLGADATVGEDLRQQQRRRQRVQRLVRVAGQPLRSFQTDGASRPRRREQPRRVVGLPAVEPPYLVIEIVAGLYRPSQALWFAEGDDGELMIAPADA